MPTLETSDAAMRRVFARQQPQDTSSLVTQLNARRTRLVELELVRARELTSVSPQVLEEIDLVQSEIAALRTVLECRQSQ